MRRVEGEGDEYTHPYILKDFSEGSGTAIDFASERRAKGAAYERHCFRELAKTYEGDLLLGPDITNYALEHAYTSGVHRPDMIGLNAVGSRWKIATFYECKSMRLGGMHYKLEGFPKLLKKLRDKPKYLPNILEELGDYEMLALRNIVVPISQEVDVVFISPNAGRTIYQRDVRYNSVTLLQIPLPDKIPG